MSSMSDCSTEDEEEDVAPWLQAAMSSCPGLVSEAALANAKRKREQEEADLAFARQLQLEEEEAAEAAAASRREEARRAEARLVRDSPRRGAPEMIMLSDSEDELSSPVPRRQGRQARPRRNAPSNIRVSLSPLSHESLNSSPSPSPRRAGAASAANKREAAPNSCATTGDLSDMLLSGIREHRQPPGPPPPHPTALRVTSLYPYQRAALGWMLRREGQHAASSADGAERVPVSGGLLADEQGMGKTVQTLSLCLSHPPSLAMAPIGGCLSCAGGGSRAALGTLIVCPLNLLRQWQREISSKVAPPFGGNVCVHHGPQRTKAAAQLASFDFVLTTYAVVRSEYSVNGGSKKKKGDAGPASSSGSGASSSSSSSAGAGSSSEGDAKGKGALFGLRWWRVVLDEAHFIRNGTAAASQACCELRATNRWALTGTPLQNSTQDLWPILKFLKYPQFGEQLGLFKTLTARNAPPGKLASVVASVMLRRCKTDRFEGEPILSLPPKHTEVVQRAFGDDEQRVYAALERSARLEFTRIAEEGEVQANYLHVLALLTRLRQACDSPELVRETYEAAEKAEADAAAAEAANGAPPTAKALERAAAMMEPGAVEDCPICMDVIQRDGGAITACGHPFCLDCIGEHVQRGCETSEDGVAKCPLCRTSVTRTDIFRWRLLPPHPPEPAVPALPAVDADAADGSGEGGPVVSTKMKLVLEAVREAQARDATNKLLVFSCYTKFLDLLQMHLDAEGVACCRVDGSQTADQRDAQVTRFHAAGIPVMLMSLKCGVGLNLTCANTVVMCEPWWNPFAEDQAADRAHRIGQQKEVRVLRLAVPGTVEDRILQLQQKKRDVAAEVLGGVVRSNSGNSAAARLSDDDLRQLFGL